MLYQLSYSREAKVIGFRCARIPSLGCTPAQAGDSPARNASAAQRPVRSVSGRSAMKLSIAALAVAALATAATAVNAKSDTVTIKLMAQNGSKQNGTATLTAQGSKTKVVISLANANPNEPAHIHPGPCKTLDPAPKYPLTNVVKGMSTTVVDASLASLMSGAFAINVHAGGGALIKKYVSCGDIPKSSGSSM